MTTRKQRNLSIEDVINAWDRVAATTQARSAIHPAGGSDDEATYFDSGREAAQTILRLASRYLQRPLEHNRVVDFGCGDGRILKWVAESVHDTWGVDASNSMLERLSGAVPSAHRLRSNAVDGRMRSLKADLIYSAAVFIHHDYAGGKAILGGLAEATSPGGLLVLQIPCFEVPRERAHWTDVTVWSEAQVRSAADEHALNILDLPISPGRFDPSDIRPEYALPVLFRKPRSG